MDELRILIADDHHLIRRGVRDLLAARNGWQVVGEASTGTDAVRKAVNLKPHIAILDFSMPELNGPEAAAHIAEKVAALFYDADVGTGAGRISRRHCREGERKEQSGATDRTRVRSHAAAGRWDVEQRGGEAVADQHTNGGIP